MADPWHHAVSSQKKWGGEVEDYLPIHQWFDETKKHFSDPRHRAIRHHSEGIGLMISIFGPTITLSTCGRCGHVETSILHDLELGLDPSIGVGREVHAFNEKLIPTRWIGEQHCLEDFGHIPTMADFLRHMTIESWMVRGARKLSRELEAAG